MALTTCEIAVTIKKDMPKNKVKKFSIVDRKLKKFRDENEKKQKKNASTSSVQMNGHLVQIDDSGHRATE